MGWFKSKAAPGRRRLLPSDTPAMLEELGRSEGPAPGGDPVRAVPLVSRAIEVAREHPDLVPELLDELLEACETAGGWSYYGAWDIAGAVARQHERDPRYIRIVDGVLDTLLGEGYGRRDIPMGLMPRLVERESG